MAVYEYTATDETGTEFSGTYNDIDNVDILRKELSKMGHDLIKAHRKKNHTRKHKRIKQSEVVTFAYEFAGMYSAGLSITGILETLGEQAENESLKHVIADIKESIETGLSLKQAFEKHKHIFSNFFIGMIEAGESGGKLATALEMSAEYLEKQAELKRKVKSAFAYPAVVSAMCLAVIVFLLIYVIPVFAKLYKQVNAPLPGPTQMLISLSILVRDWWWAVLIIVIGAGIILHRFLHNPKIREFWDSFKLNMPIFAKINRMVVVSHFTRTFAMLASVGVSLIDALDVASMVADNKKVSQIAKELQAALGAGNPFAGALQNYDIFPPMITQLAASGEKAGKLPEMLNKGTDFLDKSIERTINALLVKLEPALTVIIAAVVGFILVSAYFPMLDYMAHLE